MSKGLEALKDIRETYIDSWYGVHRCEIIEKELKEYDLLKEHANKYGADNLDEIMRLIHNGWVYERKEKALKALEILIKWYQPDIIHDLCCFGASDEELALVKEILYGHR